MTENTVQFDQRSLDRAKKTLAKYQGRSLGELLKRGAVQATRLMVGPMRAAAPRGATGRLKASVKAGTAQSGVGAIVRPTDRKRHLVIQPHRIVTPGGRDTGRRTQGNPFVDAVGTQYADAAVREVMQILFP